MATIGAYEAKTHLSQLLERVAQGERIVITKHGVPVAVLEPASPAKRADPKKVIAALKALRRDHRLDGLSMRELIEEGRA
ncbi:MAG TPA: type II toxin-antitoxin system prevent-host-death family antitoxin [Candidatus Fraserbacteria bacterium]|nr:type II toxin-antitoxin system prevent-host-death family antitoxin [Candidatus Fraserbacteria bacterium]